MQQKSKGGRPRTGAVYHIPVRTYETPEGIALIEHLTARRGLGVAALLRTLIREESERLDVSQERAA